MVLVAPSRLVSTRVISEGPERLVQLQNLGQQVLQRRTDLGLSRDQVAQRGGPSDTTLVRIEFPTEATSLPKRATLDRLDVALAWAPGSAEAVLNRGEQPTPLREAPASVSGLDSLAWVELRMETLWVIVSAISSIPAEHRSSEWAQDLQAAASALMAAHTTEVLERAGGPGRELPPIFHQTYLPYLAESSAPPDDGATALEHAEWEERLYRRWLAGLATPATGLSDPQVAQFTTRWHAKQALYMAREEHH